MEKHAMDDSASQGPAHKKLKEKMPDFDWAANNYALTWRLVEELRRPENKTILFPEIEGVKVSRPHVSFTNSGVHPSLLRRVLLEKRKKTSIVGLQKWYIQRLMPRTLKSLALV